MIAGKVAATGGAAAAIAIKKPAEKTTAEKENAK
jgi:hypothetical protein